MKKVIFILAVFLASCSDMNYVAEIKSTQEVDGKQVVAYVVNQDSLQLTNNDVRYYIKKGFNGVKRKLKSPSSFNPTKVLIKKESKGWSIDVTYTASNDLGITVDGWERVKI